MTWAAVLLGVFILFAYTVEAVTGFGSIVIALSLGALLFPIDWLQTVLVPLNICMTGYLSWSHRRAIDVDLLLRLILPFMLLGTFFGVMLQPWLSGAALKLFFSALVIWFALRELWRARRGNNAAAPPRWLAKFWVLVAGVSHGLFASGGPLLVYALTGVSMNKARFRATLILVWFSLNSMLTLVFLYQGRLQPHAMQVLMYLPLIPIGIYLGEHLHQRVDETAFRLWIYRMLVVAGVALMSATLLPLLQV